MSWCGNGLACNLTALMPDYQSRFTNLTDMCRLCRLCRGNGNGNGYGAGNGNSNGDGNGSKVVVNLQDLLAGLAL
jgi:hypothetical protein